MSLSLLLSTLTCQVKRRLQEVILQRKRREAAASMGNLPTLIPGPPGELSLVHTLAMLTSDWSGAPSGAAAGPPTALLRKVQSESNLLKIKNRRERAGAGAPYSHRGANMHGNNILPKVSIDSKFIFTLPCVPPGTGGVLQLVPEHAAAADLSSAASTPSPLSCTATQLGAAQPVQVTTALLLLYL